MTWFPFDEQICDLKFGTWTNHESLVIYIFSTLWHLAQVNLTMNDGNGGAVYSGEADTSTFSENAEWHLVRSVSFGTTNISPVVNFTSPSLNWIDISPSITIKVSSVSL